MDYCFSTDSHNSTGSSSSSVAPNTTTYTTTAAATTTSKGKKKTSSSSSGNNRRSVKLSTDPQSVAARERRHRISDRFKILQSLVPGGSKMDTVSMLEEAIHYVKFLKAQIWLHQNMMINFSDHHHHEPSNFLPGTPLVIPSHQEGFYSSNSTNFAPLLLQPSTVPLQLPLPLTPPPPQAFQDLDRFQGHDHHHQESMSLDEYYIKY